MRLFKEDELRTGIYKFYAFEDKDVSKEYNVFGFMYKDEDFKEELAKYKKERNQYVKESLEYNNKQSIRDILKEFQEGYTYFDCRSAMRIGRPTLFVEYNDDEWVVDPENYYWADDFSPVNENDLDFVEFYEYIGRSGWTKKYLSPFANPDIEEASDFELQSFESKKYLFTDRPHHYEFKEFYYDKERKILWQRHVSSIQGHIDYFEMIDDEETIAKILVLWVAETIIEEIAPWVLEEYGRNLVVIEKWDGWDELNIYDMLSNDALEEARIASRDDFKEIEREDNGNYGTITFAYKDMTVKYHWSTYADHRSRFTTE